MIRPSAVFRHKGIDRLFPLLLQELMGIDLDLAAVANDLKVDTSRPGFLKVRWQDIEYITAAICFDKCPRNGQGDKLHAQGGGVDEPMHRFMLGTPSVRMILPFDWLAFLRQWRFEFEEVRVKGRTYHRIRGHFKSLFGPNPCVFVADERTIVFDEEDVVRKIAAGEDAAPPAYVGGRGWERATSGLVAIAITNQNGTFAKHYDLGRPDDAKVLSVFKGIDTWILGVEDSDAIVLQADAISRDRDALQAVRRSLESLITLGRQYIEQNVPKSPDAGLDAQAVHDQGAGNKRSRRAHNRRDLRSGPSFWFARRLRRDSRRRVQEAKARVAEANEAKKF